MWKNLSRLVCPHFTSTNVRLSPSALPEKEQSCITVLHGSGTLIPVMYLSKIPFPFPDSLISNVIYNAASSGTVFRQQLKIRILVEKLQL